MSNKLLPSNNGILPNGLENMTLNQLINQEGVEIKKKDNITKIKKITPSQALTVEIRTYDEGITVSQSKIVIPEKKKDLHATAKKMKQEGKTQSEIADILGTTQPYISKMLKMKDK